MKIELILGPRSHWVEPSARQNISVRRVRVPWWKPEGWFYPADKDSHWSLCVAWLWIKIRLGGGSE